MDNVVLVLTLPFIFLIILRMSVSHVPYGKILYMRLMMRIRENVYMVPLELIFWFCVTPIFCSAIYTMPRFIDNVWLLSFYILSCIDVYLTAFRMVYINYIRSIEIDKV